MCERGGLSRIKNYTDKIILREKERERGGSVRGMTTINADSVWLLRMNCDTLVNYSPYMDTSGQI